MSDSPDRIRALEKIAFADNSPVFSPTVGISNPPNTVSDVLNGIGFAQVHGIGTQNDRTDAFGRIINSGLVDTSPAENAIRMVGGGILGRALTSAFTNNSFLKGLGTGFGAIATMKKW